MSLKLVSISKSFGEKLLFRDFTFSFDNAGLYVLTGKSGIGKTTLLRIISGLDKEYEGEVLGGGIKNVSYCFQEHRLFPQLSALSNVTEVSFANNGNGDLSAARTLLLRLQLTESDLNLLPNELSGGMRQRVAFARAVLRKSPILLLDEPTKELDEKTKAAVMEVIEEESKKRTVIMVTHDSDDLAGIGATVISLD